MGCKVNTHTHTHTGGTARRTQKEKGYLDVVQHEGIAVISEAGNVSISAYYEEKSAAVIKI